MVSSELVLVTGASGYLGAQCVLQLLKGGYKVRGTIRSVKDEEKVKALKGLCPEAATNLELVQGDLQNPDCWPNAVKGCDYVLHVASPFPAAAPDHEDELIKPAVEGVVNVLKACSNEPSVKRVVQTSSGAAIFPGRTQEEMKEHTFSEKDWCKMDGANPVGAYVKSKTLAEKAAWDFVKGFDGSTKNKFELSVINPVFILGPVAHKTEGTSVKFLKRMMCGEMASGVPKSATIIVDVRDVAKAHVIAMKHPAAAGERFLLHENAYWYKEIADALAKEFLSKGYKIPTEENKDAPAAGASAPFKMKIDNKKVGNCRSAAFMMPGSWNTAIPRV